MNRDEVRDLLVKTITEIQKQSGRPVGTLDDDVLPFSDLEGFDSLNAEEVTTLLSEEVAFDDDLNPFEDADGTEVTIGQIADRLASVVKKKEKVS